MIKYTVTVNDGESEQVAYLETKYPLKGGEDVLAQRLEALAALLEQPDKAYFDAFKEVIHDR